MIITNCDTTGLPLVYCLQYGSRSLLLHVSTFAGLCCMGSLAELHRNCTKR